MSREVDGTACAAWLRGRRVVAENKAPYFIRWVERLQRLRAARAGEAWQDTLRVFLEDLGAARTPDWQIRQAADAITLCWTQLLPRRQSGKVPGPPASGRLAAGPPGVLAEMERLMRLRHHAPRTLRSYPGRARRFLQYLEHGGRAGPPTSEDAKAYLTHLATRRHVSASTQNQAFSALLFLYRNVYEVQLEGMSSTLRARRGRKLPVVLSVDETRSVLGELNGTPRLILELV